MTGRATDYSRVLLFYFFYVLYVIYFISLSFLYDMCFVFHMLLFYNMLFNMFISLGVCRVIDYFRETMETFIFFKLRIKLMSHNDMWLACGVRGQFIHLSVLSRCTAICVLV